MTNAEWTKKLDYYFIAAARKWFRWSPAYREVLARAFVRRSEGVEYFKCENCHSEIPRPKKQVDHRIPVVDRGGWDGSWDTYRDRIFVTADKLDLLCKSCHSAKTKKENAERRKTKKEKTQ